MVYSRTFLPNKKGHNYFALGSIEPGVSNLIQLFFRDYQWNEETEEYVDNGPQDFTGWTGFEMQFLSSRAAKVGYVPLFTVQGVIEPIGGATGGGTNWEVVDRFVEFFILTAEELYGFKIQRGSVRCSAVNPDGVRVSIGRGSWHLGEGGK